MMCDAPIYFEAQGRSGEVTGSFTAFGMPEAAISRAGDKIKLTLAFIKVDKTVQKAEIDITEVVTNSESGGSGGGNVDEPPTEIELPLDEKVKVEKPTTNPDGGGVGGIYPGLQRLHWLDIVVVVKAERPGAFPRQSRIQDWIAAGGVFHRLSSDVLQRLLYHLYHLRDTLSGDGYAGLPAKALQ